jgi:hypothetical protein
LKLTPHFPQKAQFGNWTRVSSLVDHIKYISASGLLLQVFSTAQQCASMFELGGRRFVRLATSEGK